MNLMSKINLKEFSEKKFLNPIRRKQATESGRSLLQEVTSDRVRVIFSNPFRRLQQKAQVFSLEPNTAVRSRMTHSIEVSHIGKSICLLVAKQLKANKRNDIVALSFIENANIIAELVETTCLMHDIGNPPFGHFGEKAIQDWFKNNASKCVKLSIKKMSIEEKRNINKLLFDFIQFDGNCQGLRLITKLQWDIDEFGLNLSYPQLASFIKYLRKPKRQASSEPFYKKPEIGRAHV